MERATPLPLPPRARQLYTRTSVALISATLIVAAIIVAALVFA